VPVKFGEARISIRVLFANGFQYRTTITVARGRADEFCRELQQTILGARSSRQLAPTKGKGGA